MQSCSGNPLRLLSKQVCVIVGCVLPALYRKGGLCPAGSLSGGVSVQLGDLCPGVKVGGSLSMAVSVQEGSLSRGDGLFHRDPLPPVDRQTPVKILPCPKLRLGAVIRQTEYPARNIDNEIRQQLVNTIVK